MEELHIDNKYSVFIEKLIEQVSKVIPSDVNTLQENYLKANMRKSMSLLVSSFDDTEVFKLLTFEEQCFYIQIMGEWSFHKEIDLFRSGIPAKYWKVVMNKIWYVMWEVLYACVKNEAPQVTTLKLVERFVNRSYKEAIEELSNQNIIDHVVEEKAMDQSNIDKLAKEIRIYEKMKANVRLTIRRFVFAIICASIISLLILKLKMVGVVVVLTTITVYYFMPNNKND